eukprot:33950_1
MACVSIIFNALDNDNYYDIICVVSSCISTISAWSWCMMLWSTMKCKGIACYLNLCGPTTILCGLIIVWTFVEDNAYNDSNFCSWTVSGDCMGVFDIEKDLEAKYAE